MKFVIRSKTKDAKGKAIFWSVTQGWVAHDSKLITQFTQEDRQMLPLPTGGEWESRP